MTNNNSHFQTCDFFHDHAVGDPSYDDCQAAAEDVRARVAQVNAERAAKRLETGARRKAVTNLRKALEAYWRENDLWYDAHWYSKNAWHERGEPYGNDAVLNLTFEGPLYRVFNGSWESRRLSEIEERSRQIAQEHGFWFELGFAWSAHFYRNDQ